LTCLNEQGFSYCESSATSIILGGMSKGRLEAFSDGVVAILITIMVLELRVPEGTGLDALANLGPIIFSYVLSYIFLGIYWVNHHHLWQAAKEVNGSVLWANLHLLFWLSLVPFVTGWMGENNFAQLPVALYGVVLWMAGLAYYILTIQLIKLHGSESVIATALGRRVKEVGSLVAYAVAVAFAFINTGISLAIYVLVALTWLIPDRRIERIIGR
jgi:TMEM175 potassium channel family protein